MDREFTKFYNEFCEAFNQKNYSQVINLIPNFPMRHCTLKTYSSYEVLLRHSILAIVAAKSAKPSNSIELISNAYLKLFEIAAKAGEIKLVLESIWKLKSRTQFSFNSSWLSRVIETISNSNICSKEELNFCDFFILSTNATIGFVLIEKDLLFENTITFIDWCKECKFSANAAKNIQTTYYQCFQLIRNALKMLSNDKSSQEYAQKVLDGLTSLQNESGIDKQYKEDTAITICQILVNNINQFLNAAHSLEHLECLIDILLIIYTHIRSAQYDKQLCTYCTDIKRHIAINLGQIGFLIFKNIHSIMTAKCLKKFFQIFYNKLIILKDFKCETANYLRSNADIETQNILCYVTTTKNTANLTDFGLKLILKIVNGQTSIYCNVDITSFLISLRKLYQSNGNDLEVVRSGLVLIVFYLSKSTLTETQKNHILTIFYEMGNKQQEQPEEQFRTAIEHLNDIGPTYQNAITVPAIDPTELLLWQLKTANMYKTLNIKFKLKIVETIFQTCTDPVKSLRILYYTDSTDLDNFSNYLNKAIKQLPKKSSIEIRSIRAAYQWSRYFTIFTKTKLKYKETSFDWTLENLSIFNDLNIKYENRLVEILQNALDEYTIFERLYQNCSEKTQFTDEVNHAIYCLKWIAYHFTLRIKKIDAMKANYLLYTLSNSANDKYSLLTAVSFFADNETIFRQQISDQNLHEIVAHTDGIVYGLIETMDKLSARKQNVILHFMLNLVVYHLNLYRLDDAKQILQFIEHSLNQFSNGEFGSVRCKYYSVLFMMKIKFKIDNTMSTMIFAEHLIENCKNIVFVSMDDTIVVPIILCDTLIEIFEYSLAAYDFQNADLCLLMVMKMVTKMGMVIKSAELLSLSALADLYKEDINNCEMKLNHLNSMFLISTEGTDAEENDSPIDDRKKSNVNFQNIGETSISPVRKSSVRCISPFKVRKHKNTITISRYITEHNQNCSCSICTNSVAKLLMFTLAYLTCHSLNLKKDYQTGHTNFNYLHEMWIKLKTATNTTEIWKNMSIFSIRMQICYAKSLFRHEEYKKGHTILQETYNELKKQNDNSNFVLRQDVAIKIISFEDFLKTD